MKKITLIILIVLSSILLNAQSWECFTPPDTSPCPKSGYVYDPNGPVKTIRVNFHFMLTQLATHQYPFVS